jgi:putative transposase
MSGDVHVQFSERLRVKPPGSTQPYLKVKGQWVYLYRAVHKDGDTLDFMLSVKAMGSSGVPDKVTMDKSGANKAGIDTINLRLALLFMISGLFLQINVR